MLLYSLHRTLAPAYPIEAPPVNAVLFFDEGTRLASGGDDGVVRIWDVRSGDCQQELTDSLNRWGQITCLTLTRDSSGRVLDLFIGGGRGVVSSYPWNQRTQYLAQQGYLIPVFQLDEAVEAQDIDSSRSKFAVASIKGQIKLYAIQNRNSFAHLWTYTVASNIPRSLLFFGDSDEQLAVHNLNGPVLYLDPASGTLISQRHGPLIGGVGSVALSPNRRMKAIHNIASDRFDLYGSGATNPIGLRVSSSTGKIKGVAFGEDGQVLVCGGDDGFIHIFDPVQAVEQETLTLSSDCSTVYALTTCTSKEYHLIAGGGSASPATIYIWKKPTEYKQDMDRSDAREREATEAQALQQAQEQARADRTAQLAREEKAAREAEVKKLTGHVYSSKTEVGVMAFLVVFSVVMWCVLRG